MPELNDGRTKLVKASELFELTGEILEQDGHVWITVTGNSMYPFMSAIRDSVELSKTTFKNIKKGDIVLVKRENGAFVLHRVLKKGKDCFYIIGDAQQWIEGPLNPRQLFAVVCKIKRKGKIINCNNIVYRIIVFTWMIVIPFRYRIFKFMKFIYKQAG